MAFLISAGLAASVSADEGRWYLNPAIGLQNFDSKRNLDDATTLTLGGEYRYNDQWATELRFLDSNADSKIGDTDVNQYYLDALYYFKPMTAKWQPFAILGVGHAEFEGKLNDDKETQANAGLGVRYALNDNWSLRGDVRGIYGTDDSTWDSLINVGVSYAFGGSSAPAPAPVPVEADTDQDGVPDTRDNCPNTPAGAAVDAKGCALDSDEDGVPDYKDQCPSTPKGRKVDDQGCKVALEKDISMKLSVNFATNSADVTGSIDNIDKVVQFLKTYPEVPVEISGHTDDTGSAEYNKNLSQRRADAVRNILINNYGIAGDNVTAIGYGEDQPVTSNETAEGRAANRRVEATLKHKIKQ
ncbi:hypothetical protein GZ78_21535 [Endozoicomonas numazuensis]|uniref:OmpA-like domain-containing protein n=1 Tax=Endozoicomonas numazuensis TaxID=1137799 RepID=A0A081NDC3_9GAMM|nr:hypothetical protein GZ78_21535 [Endozoicomonas numazuensis]